MSQANFLVAVDLTEEAEEVLAAAHKLATQRKAKLVAITVVRPMLAAYGDIGFGSFSSSTFELEAEARKLAQAKLAQIAAPYGVEPQDCSAELGSPAAEIRRMAEEISAQMIILGTHSRHGVGLLLGSTASGVLHGAPCDVLAVKV